MQLQDMCIDIDEENRLKKLAFKRQATQDEQSTKAHSKTTFKGQMKFNVGTMLGQKKVVIEEPKDKSPKKSYVPSGGMVKFFKQNKQPQASVRAPVLFK
jgi:hypothetical protein